MSRDTGGYFDWGNFLWPSREEVQVQASCVRCDVHALCQELGTTSCSLTPPPGASVCPAPLLGSSLQWFHC